jgi:hypothetical protein
MSRTPALLRAASGNFPMVVARYREFSPGALHSHCAAPRGDPGARPAPIAAGHCQPGQIAYLTASSLRVFFPISTPLGNFGLCREAHRTAALDTSPIITKITDCAGYRPKGR